MTRKKEAAARERGRRAGDKKVGGSREVEGLLVATTREWGFEAGGIQQNTFAAHVCVTFRMSIRD